VRLIRGRGNLTARFGEDDENDEASAITSRDREKERKKKIRHSVDFASDRCSAND
jgi:hypothetical protein